MWSKVEGKGAKEDNRIGIPTIKIAEKQFCFVIYVFFAEQFICIYEWVWFQSRDANVCIMNSLTFVNWEHSLLTGEVMTRCCIVYYHVPWLIQWWVLTGLPNNALPLRSWLFLHPFSWLMQMNVTEMCIYFGKSK